MVSVINVFWGLPAHMIFSQLCSTLIITCLDWIYLIKIVNHIISWNWPTLHVYLYKKNLPSFITLFGWFVFHLIWNSKSLLPETCLDACLKSFFNQENQKIINIDYYNDYALILVFVKYETISLQLLHIFLYVNCISMMIPKPALLYTMPFAKQDY